MISFADRVRQFLGEGRKEGGYKAMASSTGGSVAGTKAELKKLDREGVTAGIKKRAKGATNSAAYKWGTIQKILKQHNAKA
jgi:hypothetical protein